MGITIHVLAMQLISENLKSKLTSNSKFRQMINIMQNFTLGHLNLRSTSLLVQFMAVRLLVLVEPKLYFV